MNAQAGLISNVIISSGKLGLVSPLEPGSSKGGSQAHEQLLKELAALQSIASDPATTPVMWKTKTDDMQALFKLVGLGPQHTVLWARYQNCWTVFRGAQSDRVLGSRQTFERLCALVTAARTSALAASTQKEHRGAEERMRLAREEVRTAPRMLSGDWQNIQVELDEVQRDLRLAGERVREADRERATQAYRGALQAFEHNASGSFQTFKDAQLTIRDCWLSSHDRQVRHDEMAALFSRFQAKWQDAKSQHDAWRDRQRDNRDKFRVKVEKTRAYIVHQEQCAVRCRETAVEGCSEAFSDDLYAFAEQHARKAEEAREVLARLEAILADIEARLAAPPPVSAQVAAHAPSSHGAHVAR